MMAPPHFSESLENEDASCAALLSTSKGKDPLVYLASDSALPSFKVIDKSLGKSDLYKIVRSSRNKEVKDEAICKMMQVPANIFVSDEVFDTHRHPHDVNTTQVYMSGHGSGTCFPSSVNVEPTIFDASDNVLPFLTSDERRYSDPSHGNLSYDHHTGDKYNQTMWGEVFMQSNLSDCASLTNNSSGHVILEDLPPYNQDVIETMEELQQLLLQPSGEDMPQVCDSDTVMDEGSLPSSPASSFVEHTSTEDDVSFANERGRVADVTDPSRMTQEDCDFIPQFLHKKPRRNTDCIPRSVSHSPIEPSFVAPPALPMPVLSQPFDFPPCPNIDKLESRTTTTTAVTSSSFCSTPGSTRRGGCDSPFNVRKNYLMYRHQTRQAFRVK